MNEWDERNCKEKIAKANSDANELNKVIAGTIVESVRIEDVVPITSRVESDSEDYLVLMVRFSIHLIS